MPPKKSIEYAVYIVDCGRNSKEQLQCLFRIIAVKYFGLPQKLPSTQDSYKVIFFNNPAGEEGISLIHDWKHYTLDGLTEYQNILECKGEVGLEHASIVEVLNSAIDCFETFTLNDTICTKRIVLISDLLAPLGSNAAKDTTHIIDQLQANDIWLYVLGPENVIKIPKMECLDDMRTLSQNWVVRDDVDMAAELKETVNWLQKVSRRTQHGVVADTSTGFHLLFSYKPVHKLPFGWFGSLSIGDQFHLPVVVTKTTRNREVIKYDSFVPENAQGSNLEKCQYDVNTHEKVPKEDIVAGYQFQGREVVFTPEQEANMAESKKAAKCLSIFAFMDADDSTFNSLYFMPGSVHLVTVDHREGVGSDVHKVFRNLVKTMRSKRSVALAKYVYNNGYNPYLMAIFPCKEHTDKNGYLLMAQLPYSHEFLEHYRAGRAYKKPEAKEEVDEVKWYMYGLLDALNTDELNLLPEYLRQNESRMFEAEYLAMRTLNDDGIKPAKFKPLPPELRQRSADFAQLLYDHFN